MDIASAISTTPQAPPRRRLIKDSSEQEILNTTSHSAGAPAWERAAGQGNPRPHPGVASGPYSCSVRGSPATNPWSCRYPIHVSEIDQPSQQRPLPDPCIGPSLASTRRQPGAKKIAPTSCKSGHQRMREARNGMKVLPHAELVEARRAMIQAADAGLARRRPSRYSDCGTRGREAA